MANLQLGIKETGIRLNDADGLVVSAQCVDTPDIRRDHSHDIQPEILRVHFRCEAVADALFTTGWNLHIVAGTSDIAHDHRAFSLRLGIRRPERASDKG